MITLNKIITNIDKSTSNKAWIDVEQIANQVFGIQYYCFDHIAANSETSPFVGYWFSLSLCTDTEIGTIIYFFNDKFVGYSTQSGRKSRPVFAWKDRDSATTVKNWIKTLELEAENNEELIFITEEEYLEDVGEGTKVSSVDEIIGNEAIYKGIVCPIIDHHRYNPQYGHAKQITINYLGYKLIIPLEKIAIPFHLKK